MAQLSTYPTRTLTKIAGVDVSGNVGLATPASLISVRELLTADRIYYVRTDGNDSNTGLVNSAGGAFKTGQKAFDTFAMIDMNGFLATIQFGAGTFDGAIDTSKVLLSPGGLAGSLFGGIPGALLIAGVDSIGSTVLTTSSGGQTINLAANIVVLKDLEIQAASVGIYVFGTGTLYLDTGVRFGACGNIQMGVLTGGTVFIFAAYKVVGGGYAHIYMTGGGNVQHYASPAVCTGVLTFTYFAFANGGAYYEGNAGFDTSGATVTATRYGITAGGIINTLASGPNYFPGNSPGTGGTTTGDGFYA